MELFISLDIGSTTIKSVVVDAAGTILFSGYQRHESRPHEKCLEILAVLEARFPEVRDRTCRAFVTGTGGNPIAEQIGACFVQEVNALCLAVEKFHPEAQTAIELGGEDAKIVVWKTDPRSGSRRKNASMNDKCAGGTGVLLDKISAKLGVGPRDLAGMGYSGRTIYPVAGKCGVFAETDITGLQKRGVEAPELMASLFDSLVRQNIHVLARGRDLLPDVLLLGGPNVFFPGMRECWRHHLLRLWEQRDIPIPAGRPIDQLIQVPENALYFAALGAIEYGRKEIVYNPDLGRYRGLVQRGAGCQPARADSPRHSAALVANQDESARFKSKYEPLPWLPPCYPAGTTIEGFLGIDGGSTSTKAVFIDTEGNVIAKAYRLSSRHPFEDARGVLADLQAPANERGWTLKVLGVATTGYARDFLKDVLGADLALVETVAHMLGGQAAWPTASRSPRTGVICDVGGQDIKIIILKNGTVKDFRLNTQCSAGNGHYLQATAANFGYRVEEYAEAAFTARAAPLFSYGCAIFLQSEIVDFQRQGWQPNEIMAGLARVLPKNIWLYVCQMPNLASLGGTFVLQGGTQRNLAAVKAQVDFIEERFRWGQSPIISGPSDKNEAGPEIIGDCPHLNRPEILVHPHCGESGALGCALEVRRVYAARRFETSFIGLDALHQIEYSTRHDESTRCASCANRCLRTFIELRVPSGDQWPGFSKTGARPQRDDRLHSDPRFWKDRATDQRNWHRNIIIANCEKGAVDVPDRARKIQARLNDVKMANPNLAEVAAREAFKPVRVANVADVLPARGPFMLPRRRRVARRHLVRIGMPRAMNFYFHAPFFTGFFCSLGIPPENIVWSDGTTERLFQEGASRGSIDPCYPSKLALAHVHNLVERRHSQQAPLDFIFFPIIDRLPTWLDGVMDSCACPTSTGTVEATYAAFVKDRDLFAEKGIRFKKPFIDLADERLCARQLHEAWADELGLSRDETTRAVGQGFRALEAYQQARRAEGRAVLDALEESRRLGIVILGRPYHNDPGINHGIPEQLRQLGYPILTVDSLPLDAEILAPLFAEETAGPSPLNIDDVWKNSYAKNSSEKLWAAKYVARHPLLIGVELSNFKCGHDAPAYAALEEIIEAAGKPFFYFRDIDENNTAGAIKIRIDTIAYFLQQYLQVEKSKGSRYKK